MDEMVTSVEDVIGRSRPDLIGCLCFISILARWSAANSRTSNHSSLKQSIQLMESRVPHLTFVLSAYGLHQQSASPSHLIRRCDEAAKVCMASRHRFANSPHPTQF